MSDITIPEFIREETRKRCLIVPFDEQAQKKLTVINIESFHFLYDVPKIKFSIYVHVDSVLVEFMKPEEFSPALLDQIQVAINSGHAIEIMILRTHREALDQLLADVRAAKIQKLAERDPQLDRKTLAVFSNLSSASQLVVKGAITSDVIKQVKNSSSFLVNNLQDNDIAIATLSRMVTHDPTLYDHSASVAMISAIIAMQCLDKSLGRKDVELVTQSGLYHDVGKTCIPSNILNKPSKFTAQEFEVMKTHAELGEKELLSSIAGGAMIDPLIARIAGEHHERFNGKGYPRGKKGKFEENPREGIHLFTRIVTIADVYSALLMRRIYKPAYEPQDAIKIMAKVAKEEYDPAIFTKFLLGVVKSLNVYQEKLHGKGKGRILQFDPSGQLQEKKKIVI